MMAFSAVTHIMKLWMIMTVQVCVEFLCYVLIRLLLGPDWKIREHVWMLKLCAAVPSNYNVGVMWNLGLGLFFY